MGVQGASSLNLGFTGMSLVQSPTGQPTLVNTSSPSDTLAILDSVNRLGGVPLGGISSGAPTLPVPRLSAEGTSAVKQQAASIAGKEAATGQNDIKTLLADVARLSQNVKENREGNSGKGSANSGPGKGKGKGRGGGLPPGLQKKFEAGGSAALPGPFKAQGEAIEAETRKEQEAMKTQSDLLLKLAELSAKIIENEEKKAEEAKKQAEAEKMKAAEQEILKNVPGEQFKSVDQLFQSFLDFLKAQKPAEAAKPANPVAPAEGADKPAAPAEKPAEMTTTKAEAEKMTVPNNTGTGPTTLASLEAQKPAA